MPSSDRIVITGAAGLVGQNLVLRLKARGYRNLLAIDKHPSNTALLRRLHPDLEVVEADLAEPGAWEAALAGADVLVFSHAQIGGIEPAAYLANNVTATEQLLAVAARHGVPYILHISSSVVESIVEDHYTRTKERQEALVLESGIPCCVLRPTLMFGWFDRKHIGWLARFMKRMPVFPIPGHGRYLRQPLYSGDFCDIVIACVEQRRAGEVHNISGLEKIDYIDLIAAMRRALGLRRPLLKIPYGLFWGLLKAYSWLDRDPPFTTDQLEALVAPDVFETIDWPGLFGVEATPLRQALEETFRHPDYAEIALDF